MKIRLTLFPAPTSRSASRGGQSLLAVLACCLAICLGLTGTLSAQLPGSLDAAFDPGTSGLGGDGVNAVAIQGDGKLIIGGKFAALNGVAANYARLNPDGSLDTTFSPGSTNDRVQSVALQSDGKVLIGGSFTAVNGVPRAQIARLNADGSLDATFDPAAYLMTTVASIAPRSDGKVVIGGDYLSKRGYLYLLNADGSVNTISSLLNRNRFDAPIYTISLQSDGRILVGGAFSAISPGACPGFACFTANGSNYSPSLNNGPTPTEVHALALQGDGKLILGGIFRTKNSFFYSYQYIVRFVSLNNLTIDYPFSPNGSGGTGPNNTVNALTLQSDGKIVIGGNFTSVGSVARGHLTRLNADGSLDPTFDSGGTDGNVSALALQSDGKLIVAGSFTKVNGVARKYLARLSANGGLDTSFLDLETAALNPATGANNVTSRFVRQTDGKLLISGDFTSIGGVARNRVARLNPDGSFDPTFDPGSGPNGAVSSLALSDDGKIVLGGYFTTVNGAARRSLARLNADGSLDTSFDPGSGFSTPSGFNNNANVYALTLQDDGKLLISGDFTSIGGVARNRVARLNPDGSLDPTFDPGSGLDYPAYTLVQQSDGKVVIGGDFGTVNDVARKYLARLNTDGGLDASFDPGTIVNPGVLSVALQSDGKMIVGCDIYLVPVDRGDTRRLIRLNADGSMDASFDLGSGVNGSINGLALQSDGKVLLGGSFTTINSFVRRSVARLNADGQLDASFDPGGGANNSLTALTLLSNGKVLVSGSFTAFNGVGRAYIARLNGGVAPPAAPSLLGNSVDTLHTTSAVLHANVAPQSSATTAFFQYGLTADYGNATPAQNLGAGTSPVAVSATLGGLTSGTLYHYRVVAANAVGTTNGPDATFTTPTLAQDWRQQFFGTTSNTGTAADAADPDGDGIPNLLERALGLDPKTAGTAGLPTVARDTATGRLTLTATKGAFATDLLFSAEASSDLLTWSTAGVTVLTNTAATFQARDDAPATGGNRRFLRLRVTAP